MKRKILIVAVHPDDAELGCAGAICEFLRLGYEVIVVYLTRGECGGDPDVREQESRHACQLLGVKAENIFLGSFRDTRITDSKETIDFIEKFVDDDVYLALVPSIHDNHQDHRHAALAARTAFRNVPRILAYESPTATEEFMLNAFVDTSAHVQAKREALLCHNSQTQKHRTYLEYKAIVSLAALRGQQAGGLEFAEAFEVVRYVIDLPVIKQRNIRSADAVRKELAV